MNIMQSLVLRRHVAALAVSVGCAVAAVTPLSNGLMLDPQTAQAVLVFDLIRGFTLGTVITYGLGLLVMRANLVSRRLEHQASHDYLTGALTRARFFSQLAALPQVQGAVVLFDLDGLKTINDSLGHAAGDAALVKVATAAAAHLGPQDLLCRLGGDEFIAFFSGISPVTLHSRVRSIAMDILDQTVGQGDQIICLSASFGVAVLNLGDSADAVIAMADADLYRAKSQRRRSIV